MVPEKPNGGFRIKLGVEHPMVRLAEPDQIVRIIIPRLLIDVRDVQRGIELQSADSAAFERVGLGDHASGFGRTAHQ